MSVMRQLSVLSAQQKHGSDAHDFSICCIRPNERDYLEEQCFCHLSLTIMIHDIPLFLHLLMI